MYLRLREKNTKFENSDQHKCYGTKNFFVFELNRLQVKLGSFYKFVSAVLVKVKIDVYIKTSFTNTSRKVKKLSCVEILLYKIKMKGL